MQPLCIGISYPHWGKKSGYARFLDYLDPQEYRVTRLSIPLGSDLFWSAFARGRVKKFFRRRGRRAFVPNDLVAELKAIKSLIFKPPDVIHFLDGEHTAMILPVLSRWLRPGRRRPAIVASFHQPPHILKELVGPEPLGRVDLAVTVSESQNEWLAGILGASRVMTVPHGIDTFFFNPDSGPRDNDFRLITVGKWLRDLEAAAATARLLEEAPVGFDLVSPGELLPALPSNVKVHTGLSDEELRDFYRRAGALFLPLTASTANNALLEGMACGLPVISTDLPSVREYAPQEAVLIKGNRPEALARSILELLADPQHQMKMSTSSERRAKELAWEKVAPEYVRAWRRALDIVVPGRRQ